MGVRSIKCILLLRVGAKRIRNEYCLQILGWILQKNEHCGNASNDTSVYTMITFTNRNKNKKKQKNTHTQDDNNIVIIQFHKDI